MKATVISLERRKDRLEEFRRHFEGSQLDLTVQPAVDGRALELTEELKKRINPWNLENLEEPTLRGVLGCALSHLTIWEKLATQPDSLYLVMEDDARFIDETSKKLLQRVAKEAPKEADLIWINDWERPPHWSRFRRMSHGLDRRTGSLKLGSLLRKLVRKVGAGQGEINFSSWSGEVEKTTEGYLITPAYARKLYETIKDDIGAIDEHMRGAFQKIGGNVYVAIPSILTQEDRSDSDIQSPAK